MQEIGLGIALLGLPPHPSEGIGRILGRKLGLRLEIGDQAIERCTCQRDIGGKTLLGCVGVRSVPRLVVEARSFLRGSSGLLPSEESLEQGFPLRFDMRRGLGGLGRPGGLRALRSRAGRLIAPRFFRRPQLISRAHDHPGAQEVVQRHIGLEFSEIRESNDGVDRQAAVDHRQNAPSVGLERRLRRSG